ncbi:MAG: type I-U CRISPR-associated helicase/endonuclease Cas3, partial [Myxococcota bacterium]
MSKLSFEAFFKEVHGYSPFPWQSRLAARVTETGRWPRLLDLPTGVGKTSAIDVALYALAVNPERAPRRIVLVVDRRIIVDQAADHAEFILLALGQARKGPAREVADRLRRLWGAGAEQAPFQTAVLRGGLPRQSDWARRPDMPVVALSTVDQAGSRLLFRGYGVSTSMAPIHAGLLGEDALFLLDEVHLSEPFRETLASIESRWRPNVGLQSRFQVVEMSATPGRELPEADVLELEDEDRGHPVLEQRLGARKPTRFEAVKVTGRDESKKRATLARAAAEAAKELVEEGARTVGVVLNRVETARRTWAALQEEGRVDAVLLTGRMRPLDRDRLLDPKGKYWPRIRAGRKTRASGESLIVVATQTIEAGADLDFDGLVTECASLDALRQRFGRLDRRGEVAGDQMVNLDCAKGVVLVRSDQMADSEDDPVYGGALARTAGFLESLGDDLDFGLSSLSVPEGEALEALLAGRPRAPTLMPAYIDRWVQTSPPPQPSPELALFLHGTESPTPELSVVWRSEIDRLLQQRGEISQEKLTALLTACPPRAEEALALPLPAAKAWLGGSREADVSDAVGAGDGAGQAKDREDATAWVWTENGVQRYRLRDLYPGALVVLGVGQGGLTAENWDPSSEEPVTDLGDKAQFESVRRRGRGRATLRLWTETLSGFGAPDGFGSGFEVPADDDVDLSQAVVDWLGERMVHEGTSAFEQVT